MRSTASPPIGATFTLWHTDPKYDQLHDQELHVPYTPYTLLAVGYTDSNIYGGPTGPGAPLPPDGSAFESLSVRLTLHDSTEVERMGLGVRQMLRLLAPAINESPVLAMLDDASSSHSIRTFVDQLSETGHELAIIGFGAKGWCGMCLDQLRNATFQPGSGMRLLTRPPRRDALRIYADAAQRMGRIRAV